MSAKKALYARENIAEYWIVDIKNRKLIVCRFPEGEDYQEQRELSGTEAVSPLAFQDISIPVADIFAI